MLVGLVGQAGAGKDAVAAMIAPRHLVFDGTWVDVRERDDDAFVLMPHAVQIALADPMKVFARTVYGFSYQQLWGPSALRNAPDLRYKRVREQHTIRSPWTPDGNLSWRCEVCGLDTGKTPTDRNANSPEVLGPCEDCLTPREALQKLGTEWGRTCHPDTWVRLGLRHAAELLANVRTCRCPGSVASYRIEQTSLVVFSDIRFENEAAAIRAAGGAVWKIDRPGAGLSGQAAAHVSETEQLSGALDPYLTLVIKNTGTLDDLRRTVDATLQDMIVRRAPPLVSLPPPLTPAPP